MDDKEYYSIKRITSLTPEQLQKNLKKNKNNDFNYKQTAIRQGKDDADMLLERLEESSEDER